MSRFAIFLTTVLLIWAAMHSYVFWRVSTIPWASRHLPWWAVASIGLAGWSSYPLSRMLENKLPEIPSFTLEYLAANWVGVLFLLLCVFAAADLLTLGGFLWSSKAGQVRGWAACLGFVLAVIALIQGHRDPVVTEHEVRLARLPRELDGTVLVAFSDIHLGTMIRDDWVRRMVGRVNGLKPDLIVAVGDVVDGNAERVVTMAPLLKGLRAPLGIWGVTGNHDYYAGVERSIRFFEASGISVVRDSAVEVVPGLVIAGVDDLTARAQFGASDHPVEKALLGKPSGATIYLSHTPSAIRQASEGGADLMLSGHTHNGQIWPFTYLVRTRYPYVAGRYSVNGMTLIVARGAATWGPRMRLWHRGEILKITLRTSAR